MSDTDPHRSSQPESIRFRSMLGWGSLVYLLLAIVLGVLSGLGIFTFGYGQGASYLSNNPESCVNCHIMNES
ncbi:MAG: hypothetical protein ACNA77_08385 [Opitutales bacterium]